MLSCPESPGRGTLIVNPLPAAAPVAFTLPAAEQHTGHQITACRSFSQRIERILAAALSQSRHHGCGCDRGYCCLFRSPQLRPKSAALRSVGLMRVRPHFLRTCVWPQPLLVCADVQHVRALIEYGLCAVAVVHIPVNDQHLHTCSRAQERCASAHVLLLRRTGW
mgnify:CR=1 FL=1